ncbi:MAG: Zn-dependent peptidase ImmA (M78 family)/DNA-binding XRE family transcriptional regulator [Oceanicoccus sp.]|jgi:Zn-dependent peptidase ImmA (M78 family)/DNA-binding XRE family transcriptional regulator
MPVGVETFNGKRLLQAKNARGLTSVGLSALTDVSSSSISQYERGDQKPQQGVLERIAKALNLPTEYFLNPIVIEKPKRLFYRSMASATKASRTRVEANFELSLDVLDYLMGFFDFPDLNLPDLDVPEDFRNLDTLRIESLATQLRDHWNLGSGPIGNMIRTLESNGIVVWRTDFEAETLDAFSEYRTPHPIVVLSSDKENYFRSRFDAAHELGHMILHRNVDQTTLNKKQDFKIIEDQAHFFAGAFLLPAVAYSSDLWAPTIDAFRALKPRWNTSIAMQVMRSKQLGLVSEDQEKRLWINLSRRKWRKNEPLDDSTPSEKPNLINKSIRMLLDENVKSKEELVKDLSLYPSDIEKLTDLPIGFMRNSLGSDEPMLKKASSNVLHFGR